MIILRKFAAFTSLMFVACVGFALLVKVGGRFIAEGEMIAFCSFKYNSNGVVTHDLYLVDVDRRLNYLQADCGDYFEWSPDGQAMLLYYSTNGVWRLDVDSGQMEQVTADTVFMPRWSTDSAHITYVSNGGMLSAVNVRDKSVAQFAAIDSGDYNNIEMRWSPDGSQIGYYTKRSIRGITMDGEIKTIVALPPNEYLISAAWSPDGTQLAFSAENYRDSSGSIYVVTSTGEALYKLLTLQAARPDALEWSSDNRYLTFAVNHQEIYIFDLLTNDLYHPARANRFIYGLRWSPDGAQIAYSACIPGCDIFVMDRESLNPSQLTFDQPVVGRYFGWRPRP